MSDLVFRKIFYNSPEYHAALSIRREVFIGEQNVPEEIEIDEYECSSHHFLLTQDNLPVACGRMRIKTPTIKFERIASVRSLRGKGLGTALMKGMLEFATENYPELIPYMHSQLSAAAFYEKLGWIKQGDTFVEADIPHVVMTYSLPVNFRRL